MKKLSLLFLVIAVGLASCKKSDKESSTANFSVVGIKDVDLTATSQSSYILPISVVPNSGASDTVTLTFSGVPDGVGVDFTPATGYTPFTSGLRFSYDYSGMGGTYPVTITANGHSGSKSYTVNLTLGDYRGWKFGGVTYDRTGVAKYQGTPTQYTSVVAWGGGSGMLVINFGMGKPLPTKNKTYTISSTADTGDHISITMQDVTMKYFSTGKSTDGTNPPTGTFTFDTLGKFTFRCKNVEMSDGIGKQTLSASFSEY